MDTLVKQIAEGGTPNVDTFVQAWGGRFDLLNRLAETEQDPIWHAEGNVHIHTGMVLSELYELLERTQITPDRRVVLVLAALLHDIAKPLTTRLHEVDGQERIASPRHADRGRSFLAYKLAELGLEWSSVDAVLALVGHHHDPKQLVTRESPSREYRRLARLCDLELLYLLEQADVRGRDCADKQEQIDIVDLFREYALEYGWYGHPAPYADVNDVIDEGLGNEDALTRRFVKAQACRMLEAGTISMPQEELARAYGYRKQFAHVVVLCGPSGAGKSTWSRAEFPDYDVVGLDSIRAELTRNPADQSKNGQVRQAAKERFKESLRAHRNVVWDATNLRRDFRKLPIQLAYDYRAFVTLVVFQPAAKQALSRNAARDRKVPEHVILKQFANVEFPYADEAHEVVWVR